MVSRRNVLIGGLLGGLGAGTSAASLAQAAPLAQTLPYSPDPVLRGSFDGTLAGLRAGADGDQTLAFRAALKEAQARGEALFLPAGRYVVGDIRLSSGAMVRGVPGLTRLVYSGVGAFLSADGADLIRLQDLILDGDNRAMPTGVQGLVHFNRVRRLVLSGIEVGNSKVSGLHLVMCQGRVDQVSVSGVENAGIFALDSLGLSLQNNVINNCGNNGIQVWRSTKGRDGTLVQGNRVSDIRAVSGGTGQNGNGINIYRANHVMVSGNTIDHCRFTAIRGNAASNVQIIGNQCHRLDEVAIFSEFDFDGAIIAHNLIDDACIGIAITNFNNGGRLATCTGNLIRNLTNARMPYDEGVRECGIAAEADAAVTGNTIENSPYLGIMAGWGQYLRNVSVSANVVRDVDIGVAVSVTTGAGRASINNNLISEAKTASVAAMDHNEIISTDENKITKSFLQVRLSNNSGVV